MSTFARARVEDVRALAGAIALGSGAGLLVGGAFLAASPSAKPLQPVSPATVEAVQAHVNDRAPAAFSPPAKPVGLLASLRGRFSFDPSTRLTAKPFHFPEVAKARTDLQCLTEAVYFEARGEEKAGQQAVAQVVLNRVRHPAFPKTVCGVVHQRTASGCQFSFACSVRDDGATDNQAWRRAQTIASAALHGSVMPEVGDATHFQTARSGPFSGLLKVAQIGAHIFYRFGGHAGSADMFHQTPKPSEMDQIEVAKADPAPAKGAPAEAARSDAGKLAEKTVVAAAPSEPARPAAVAVRLIATPTETKVMALPTRVVPASVTASTPSTESTTATTKPTVVTVALAQG